jgi:hypothetical protein
MHRSSDELQEARYALARDKARGLLTLTHQRPPVDVEAIVERAGVPIVERVLIEGMRGTIGDIAGKRSIILNYSGTSCWVTDLWRARGPVNRSWGS